MMPVWQICPQCRRHFMGSDVVGDPCPECMGFGDTSSLAYNLDDVFNQMYYEDKDDRQTS